MLLIVDGENFRHQIARILVKSGKRTLILQEKGVDVRVATELLLATQKSVSNIVVGSSDSDIIPALEAARSLGAKLKYVCYDAELNRSVAASVSKVVTFDDKIVMKYFRE